MIASRGTGNGSIGSQCSFYQKKTKKKLDNVFKVFFYLVKVGLRTHRYLAQYPLAIEDGQLTKIFASLNALLAIMSSCKGLHTCRCVYSNTNMGVRWNL